MEKEKRGWFGIISLILGILGITTCLLPTYAAILSIAAIVTGAISLKKEANRGFAIAGLVLGIIGLILALLVFFAFFAFVYLRGFAAPIR